MAKAKLDDNAIAGALKALPKWKREGNAITRQHKASSVRSAVAMINRMADLAEGADHHPEVTWVYTNLTVSLSTHDSGGITALDTRMASLIDVVLDGD